MKRSIVIAAALLSLSTFACKPQDSNNSANNGNVGHGHFRQACQQDIQKFCADKQGKEMRQCLKQNLSQVSDTCRTAWQERRERMKARKAARQQQMGTTTQPAPTTGIQTQPAQPAPNSNDSDDGDDQ